MSDLFDILSRPTDPETSKEAGRDIVPSLAQLHRWTSDCVSLTPGLTQRELGSTYCPDDPRKIGRRLSECERLGLLHRGPARVCSISGRRAETWWPNQGLGLAVGEEPVAQEIAQGPVHTE